MREKTLWLGQCGGCGLRFYDHGCCEQHEPNCCPRCGALVYWRRSDEGRDWKRRAVTKGSTGGEA